MFKVLEVEYFHNYSSTNYDFILYFKIKLYGSLRMTSQATQQISYMKQLTHLYQLQH